MFDQTRPAELENSGDIDAWAEFRVTQVQERLRLLRELRDGSSPVIVNAPDGSSLTTTVWAVDSSLERLNFSIDTETPALARLVDADEAVAVAYLDSVKLQFDLNDLMLVRGAQACALQCRLPREIYRFQRRNAYRVRTASRLGPVARLRHPAIPEMVLALRVLDMSCGGCALWLPHDVPPLQAGTHLASVAVELNEETQFRASLILQHVSSLGVAEGGQAGVRLGCAWQPLEQSARRALQRWIDRSQQRRRLLHLPG